MPHVLSTSREIDYQFSGLWFDLDNDQTHNILLQLKHQGTACFNVSWNIKQSSKIVRTVLIEEYNQDVV